MRTIKNLLLTCSFVAALSSCKKDNVTPKNTISYKVDGVLKTADLETSFYTYDNSVIIKAGKADGEQISLFIDKHTRLGAFDLEGGRDKAIAVYEPGGFVSDSGKVIITSFNGKLISGTFAFRGRHNGVAKNITEGQFTAAVVNLTLYILPPDGDPSIDTGNSPPGN